MLNIYTREFCPNCDKVKDYLKNKDIEYKELDVDYFKNKAKLVVRGFLELPVIENNGVWKEFSNTSIENFIGV
jgi:glutaredoxin